MTRKKVNLAYITNESARKATFKKRKKGLMKKVSELSTLCGIDACAIIYSPYDSQPEVWPSPLGVQKVLAKFKRMPEMEQSKKMVNQESFLRQRIVKANEQFKKQRKDNREKEMIQVMFQCLTGSKSLQNFNMIDLSDLGWLIDQNLKEIQNRVESLKKEMHPHVATTSMTGPGGEHALLQPVEKPPSDHHMNMDLMKKQQWFMDLMNPQETMGFGGDELMLPFGDNNHNNLWSSTFFS